MKTLSLLLLVLMLTTVAGGQESKPSVTQAGSALDLVDTSNVSGAACDVAGIMTLKGVDISDAETVQHFRGLAATAVAALQVPPCESNVTYLHQ